MKNDSYRLFTRKATGIIRDVSIRDTVMFNINSVNPGYSLTVCLLVYTLGAAWLFGSLLTAFLFSLFFLAVFAFFTAIMPRSGGEYVFNSRTLFRGIGVLGLWIAVGGSFAMFFSESVFQSINSLWTSNTYLASALFSWGLVDLSMMLTIPVVSLFIAYIILITVNMSMLWGMKTLIKIQWIAFVVGMVGILIGGVAMWSQYLSPGGHQAFVDSINSLMRPYMTSSANPYEEISSFIPPMPFDLATTIKGSVMVFTAFGYAFFSTYFGGEIKQANSIRNQVISMFASLTISFALTVFLMVPFEGVAGQAFLGSAQLMFIIDPIAWLSGVIPVPPSAFLWMGRMTLLVEYPILNLLVQLAGVAFGFLICAILAPMLKNFPFALSFDGLLPGFIAHVDEKHHTPNFSIFIITILSMALATIFTFQQELSSLAGLAIVGASTIMFIAPFAPLAISAVIFPYVMKETYNASPAVRHKAFGIPIMSIAGLVSFMEMVVYTYFSFTDPNLGIIGFDAFFSTTVQIIFSILAASFIIAAIIVVFSKRDLFTVIPPE